MRKSASRCADCGNVYPASVDGETVTPIGRASCSRCGGDRFTEIDASALFGRSSGTVTEPR
jgi:rubredoxin